MTDRPTIHLTNFSSPKLHGPGHVYTIMARPRSWEHGDGRIDVLIPPTGLLYRVMKNDLSIEEYRAALECFWKDENMSPGSLRWEGGGESGSVADGDTLCCACAKSVAAAGRCHRAWAASFLVRAGWRVILDGREVTL